MAANPKSHTKRPEPFTGDRKKLEGFIRDCEIYVAANRADFTTDASKSQFILSYIGGGEAESWKEHYYNTVIHRTPGTLTWQDPEDLATNLRENFAREDDVEESLRKLESMRQGSRTAEEIVNEHRILMARAKIGDSALAVRMFRRALNPSLAMKILTDTTKCNTLENDVTVTAGVAANATTGAAAIPATTTINKHGWYAKAIQYDQIYREAHAAQREDYGGNFRSRDLRQSVQKGKERSWRNTTPAPTRYRDPNAMDVDAMELSVNAMSESKKSYLMKKGACFKCEVVGHMARDHDKYEASLKKPSTSFARPSSGFSPKKPDAKEIAKYIRAMNKTEQDALFEEIEGDENASDKAKDF